MYGLSAAVCKREIIFMFHNDNNKVSVHHIAFHGYVTLTGTNIRATAK